MRNIFIGILIAFICLSFNTVSAQVPSQTTPQQLEQFRKLPVSQQRALAQSMGINFDQIQRQINGSVDTRTVENKQLNTVYPRGTMFDEQGNPTLEDELDAKDEDEIKPFGYGVFANAPYTFAPDLNIAVPEDYMLGIGDTLSIQIFGKEDYEYQLPINRQGQVVLPQLGAFSVAGLTYKEAKKYFANEVKKKVLGVEVVINLTELRSMRVFVAGDAFKPGPYILSALSSVTHAIFAAGGINDIGSLRNIQVKRGGKLVTTVDLYDLLINGDSSDDITLKSGDVVFIAPVGERVTVTGEVRRPAIYEISAGDSFDSVIKMAGGLLPSAYPSASVVERFNDRNIRSIVNLDLTKQSEAKKTVRAGDLIKIMKTSEQYDDSVTIIGAVTRPGKYQWHRGQKVSDLLPNIHAYMLTDADLNYSLIVREKDIGRNIEVLQFSLFNALSNLNSSDNVELQPHDRILVFSINDKNSVADESLDLLALTEDEISDREKEIAKEAFKERMFWLEWLLLQRERRRLIYRIVWRSSQRRAHFRQRSHRACYTYRLSFR